MESREKSTKADKKCDLCRIAKQKCLPSDRNWDEKQEKCIRCIKAGAQCGPNVTQFESGTTSRGKKRKAQQSLDHGSAQSTSHARSNLGTLFPQSSSHDDPNSIEAAPGTATFFAASDDNNKPKSTARVEQHEHPVDIDSMLARINELLSSYQYINHPKKTIFLLEQDGTLERDSALRQKDVAEYLAWMIKDLLTVMVRDVNVSHCSAEHVLLLLQESVRRFRRLASDAEELLGVEIEILDKRVRIVQRINTSRGTQRETASLHGEGQLFHQQTLEMERNEVVSQIKRSSPRLSPEPASTPSSDMSAGSKRIMKQAGGLFFSKETSNLLEDSLYTSRVSYYIHSKSFAKHRQLRGKETIQFPRLYRALLFGTEPTARSWLESNDRRADLVDFFEQTVAHVAAKKGRVHLLVPTLSGNRESLDTTDAFGLTPLMTAVLHGHLESCKLLIEAGFNRDARDRTGRNLLSIACRHRHLSIVKYLINEQGFLPYDNSGRYFCSPIHDAIESGDLEVCTLLIDSGANVYQHFAGKTPSDLALEKGHIAIRWLIDEKIGSSGGGPVDAVSAHLGYQHGPNPHYNMGNDMDDLISDQYVSEPQAHGTISHSSNVPPYPPTATNTQSLDPQQLGYKWEWQPPP